MAALVIGRWSPDLIAVGILLVLALTGLVTVEQAFSGFGTPAVVAVAAIFVISAGLERTGAAALASRPLRVLAGRSQRRLQVVVMATAGLLAGFMNNLAAVGVLLPVTMTVAHRRRINPARLLLPLAYAGRFGGNLTLIAGPSNLIVADILARRGLAHLGFFDYLPLGLPMLLIGTIWIATVGRRLLPVRPSEAFLRALRRGGSRLVRVYRLSERLFEARVPQASPLIGKTIEESEFGGAYDLTIVAVLRGGTQTLSPPKSLTLRGGDRLVIEGRLDELLAAEAMARIGIELERSSPAFDPTGASVREAVLSPRSALAGQTLRDLGFRDRYGLTVLALWREGRPIRTRLADIALRQGDGLLLQGARKALARLGSDRDFILFDEDAGPPLREDRRSIALAAAAVMIVLILTGAAHVAVAASLAAGIIIAVGGLTTEEAYRSIDWRSLVLIGGMVPLAAALESSGAASAMAGALVAIVGAHPLGTLAGVLLAAVVIGQFIPSIATTILLAPLALDVAAATGASPLPFAMALVAASGMTLLTPFSNAVMLLVMAPGGYTPRDYLRAGAPLVVILFLLMMAVIPLAYPF
ncbi:MAG TPA: SLC13 family permease [bacterium]|nr:SLC13 family permease [bacterium]